ncbi:hypothetical protein GF371_04200 [Candidatus Woesearchaeota archaeon]|nr:hypothetical protein [Candidatus Woesearchaeota archaeon]
MAVKGGDGASHTDFTNPRQVPRDSLYMEVDDIYKGKLWEPGSQRTEPNARKIELNKKMYGQHSQHRQPQGEGQRKGTSYLPGSNRLMQDKHGSGDTLERITDFYQVDNQGRLQPTKEGFNNYMSKSLFDACMMYFGNAGQPARPTDGPHHGQRRGMSKSAGYGLTDLTSSFYNVADGKLQPSKHGFSAYLNVALTNAAFSYFGNAGAKAPAGYLSKGGSPGKSAAGSSGKASYAGKGK